MKYLKILTITVFSLLLLGACKKDKQDYTIPADKRYLSSVTDETGKTVAKVTYYDDKKIKTFTFGDWEYRYIYDNIGRVSSMFAKTEECLYTYNSTGKIQSFSIKGQTYPVTYNSVENSYAFQSGGTPVKIYLDAGGNCTKILAGDNNAFNANYFYQNNRKGPLTNGGSMSFTNFIFPEPMFLSSQTYLNTLASPLDGSATSMVGTTSISTSYANEFDSENFLIKSAVTKTESTANGSGTSTHKYTYHYMEL